MTATTFTIKELTGEQRELRLADRALPYQGFTLETTQRAEVTWLPGSPEATVQVLGAKDEPSTINGIWKQRFLAGQAVVPASLNGKGVYTSVELARIVDDICRKGQLLKVTWDEQIRTGIMTRCSINWTRLQDCEWEIGFEWVARGEQKLPEARTTATKSLADVWGDVSVRNAAVSAEIDDTLGAGLPIGLIVRQAMVSAQTAIQDFTDGIRNTIEAWAAGVSSALAAKRKTEGLLNSIASEAADAAQQHSRSYHRVTKEGGTPEADVSFEALLLAVRAARNARRLRRATLLHAFEIGLESGVSLVGIYTARDGDDLRDASFAFYGTPHEWRTLMTFNQLTSSALNGGDKIKGPRLLGEG